MSTKVGVTNDVCPNSVNELPHAIIYDAGRIDFMVNASAHTANNPGVFGGGIETLMVTRDGALMGVVWYPAHRRWFVVTEDKSLRGAACENCNDE